MMQHQASKQASKQARKSQGLRYKQVVVVVDE